MSFLSSLFGRGAASDEVRPDAATSLAAARVLALAGSGPDWWPYAALIARQLMAVHVAGAAAPAPVAPWRAGPDPRLWAISRGDAQSALEGGQAVADLLAAATVPRPILLGRYPNGFVYLDVARAPGPLAVRGAEPWAGWVRELLIAQLPDGTQVLDGTAPVSGAHWPVEVSERGTISVLGAAMAFGIKSPERLDLPIVPTRRTVLRDLAAGTRPPTAPEDAVAGRSDAGTRRNVGPAEPPVPSSGPVSRPAPQSAADAQPTRKIDPVGSPTTRRQPAAAAVIAGAAASVSTSTPASAPQAASGAKSTPGAVPAPAAAAASASASAPKPAGKAPVRQQSAPAVPASSTAATPAKSATPAVAAKPAGPAGPAKPAGPPAASGPVQRQLPGELYEAPAVSAAAPAPTPGSAPVPGPRSAAAPAQRGRPVPPPGVFGKAAGPAPTPAPGPAPAPGAPAVPGPPAVVEWTDVAVSSADD